MIYVVEVPYAAPAYAWSAPTKQAFFNAVQIIRPSARHGVIYACLTPRDLLRTFAGLTPPQVTRAKIAAMDAQWIVGLAERNGWYTPLFRADYVRDDGWQPSVIDKFDAYVAALSDGLALCKVYRSTGEAREGLANLGNWLSHRGATARAALSDLLAAPQFPTLCARRASDNG